MWYVYDLDAKCIVSEGEANKAAIQVVLEMARKRVEGSGGFYAPHMLVVRWIP